MMMNSHNCFVCLVVTMAIFFGTANGHHSSTVVVESTGWSEETDEYLHFLCDSNQVIIGRTRLEHSDVPRYMCGKLVNDGHQFEVAEHHWIKEQQIEEQPPSFVCPHGRVMTGEHSEHNPIEHQCANVRYKGTQISLIAQNWMKEFSITFVCPPNQVMIGRRHIVYEEVEYLCATISASFLTTPLLPKYARENSDCGWQKEVKDECLCPPFVTYYDEKQRQSLLLFVQENFIVNAQGIPFDTTEADEQIAIFTMGAFGDLYASNLHTKYLFHHSTIFAGEPVAAAGEIRVIKGEIQKMTDESGHYTPTEEINRQAVTALERQGYTKTFEFETWKLLQYDYMILKSGVKPPPAKLRFTEFDSALLGPGKTIVCGKGSISDFCRAPISLKVPSLTTIKLCFYNEICRLYNDGTHRLSDGVVKYSDFKVSAENSGN